MIHVVITVTDLTRRGLFFDGHNRARAASRIVFVPRVLVSGLKLESWFWRCGRNESLPCVRMGTDMTSSYIQSCGRSLCLLRSRRRSPHGREGRGGGWCWWPDNRLIRLPVDMVRSKVSGIPAATFSVQPDRARR